jgi:hypothetical protein
MRNLILLLLFVITCAHATAQKKKTPAANLAAADSSFLQADYDRAIPLYEVALKDPVIAKGVQPWYRLAQSYHNLRNLPKAIGAYTTAEKINGRIPFLRVNMARALSASGEITNATVMLDSALVQGFGNYKLLASDADFENLRKSNNFKSMTDRAYANSHPCASLPAAHAFDFWLGEWKVYVTANPTVQAGVNHITSQSGGCVLLESWTSQGPHEGVSINYLDPVSGKWQQKWAGSGQDVVEFYDGEYTDGAMRFKWDGTNADGTKFMGRLTFTNMDNGNVRQHSERSDDGGKVWRSVYDFLYVKVGK